MNDATRRKLKIPPWHIPYLEKHRIYELFQEMTRELVIQQPVDHVLFIKQILFHAAKARDVARIVLLSSPKVNCAEVARQIAQQSGQLIITDESIMSCIVKKKERNQVKPLAVATAIAHLVRTENAYNLGWILSDCIKNDKEAKAILQIGILPTHVFHLIPPFSHPLNELLYCRVHEGWPEYRRTIMRIRDAFKKTLIEVHLRQRGLHEVVNEILELMKFRKTTIPLIPRVLLLGPRGSGRKTQAKMLAHKLTLVHVDFEYLLCQAWISETELGEKLRRCKKDVCFHSELLTQVINKRILENDCLERGWVLTGFPNTLSDFKHLDALDTPPNRVIFLECDLNVCKERLIHRKVNVHTGSVTDFHEKSENILGKRFSTHPKDKIGIIEAELAYYCEQYGSLRSYCGGTASVVNGDQPQRWVFECISSFIVRASPPYPPRDPCGDIDTNSTTTGDSCGCTPVPSRVLDSYVTKP